MTVRGSIRYLSFCLDSLFREEWWRCYSAQKGSPYAYFSLYWVWQQLLKYHYQVSCSYLLNTLLFCFGILLFYFFFFSNLSLKKKNIKFCFSVAPFWIQFCQNMAFGKLRCDKNVSCFVWTCLNVAVNLSNNIYLCLLSNTPLSSKGLVLSFTQIPHFGSKSPCMLFDVRISLLTGLATCRFSLKEEQVYVSGRTLVPREAFATRCVPPRELLLYPSLAVMHSNCLFYTVGVVSGYV